MHVSYALYFFFMYLRQFNIPKQLKYKIIFLEKKDGNRVIDLMARALPCLFGSVFLITSIIYF